MKPFSCSLHPLKLTVITLSRLSVKKFIQDKNTVHIPHDRSFDFRVLKAYPDNLQQHFLLHQGTSIIPNVFQHLSVEKCIFHVQPTSKLDIFDVKSNLTILSHIQHFETHFRYYFQVSGLHLMAKLKNKKVYYQELVE